MNMWLRTREGGLRSIKVGATVYFLETKADSRSVGGCHLANFSGWMFDYEGFRENA